MLSQAPQVLVCVFLAARFICMSKIYTYHSGHVTDANNYAPQFLALMYFFLRHYTKCSSNHDNLFVCILFPRLCISCCPVYLHANKKKHITAVMWQMQIIMLHNSLPSYIFFAPLHNMPKQPRQLVYNTFCILFPRLCISCTGTYYGQTCAPRIWMVTAGHQGVAPQKAHSSAELALLRCRAWAAPRDI